MTTRREESYGTASQTVKDILRPLAEAMIPCPECRGTGERVFRGQSTYRNVNVALGVAHCPPCILNPRFEALRLVLDAKDYRTPPQWSAEVDEIDASLGAIVRAAAACGNVVLRTVLSAVEDALRIGAAPEGAAARALVQALVGLSPKPREH